MNLLQLFHQRFIYMQAARCIDKDIIQIVILRMLNRLSGDLHRTRLISQREDGNLNLVTQHLQLLNRRRTVDVRRYEQRAVIALLQQLRQLTGGGSLTCTLQTCHHDDSRRLVRLRQLRLASAHQLGQFLINNIDNDHAGCEAVHHFRADRLLLHLRHEVLDDLEVNVSFQKGQPHFTHRFVDIIFGYFALAAQLAEHILQSSG